MKALLAIAVILALAVPARAEMICRDNILLDSSFESKVMSGGHLAYQYQPPGTPWTFNGGAGIQRNGSDWGGDPAPEGSQTAFLQGGAAIISQQVMLGEGYYVLTYSVAKRNYGGNNPVWVYLDNQVIGYALAYDEEWIPFYVPFESPGAGLHTIYFYGSNDRLFDGSYGAHGTGDNTTFLDAVYLSR